MTRLPFPGAIVNRTLTDHSTENFLLTESVSGQ